MVSDELRIRWRRRRGSSTLVGLTDVDTSNPTDGQILVYNATSQKWVNGNFSGGGPLLITITKTEDSGYDRYETDRTVREIIDAGPTAYRVFYDENNNIYHHLVSIGYIIVSDLDLYRIVEYNYMTNMMYPMSIAPGEFLEAESLDSHLICLIHPK